MADAKMSDVRAFIAVLPDRGVVAVSGPDAVGFLDNLATNALDDLDEGAAHFAALLSPQGKILFEFMAVRTVDGFLLDTQRDRAADLAKRLGMYKLRAKVTIEDRSARAAVAALWWTPAGSRATSVTYTGDVLASFADPREQRMGARLLLKAEGNAAPLREIGGAQLVDSERYQMQRIAVGVPEGGRDYPLGDTFPHEANYDQLNGVSFTKGCFVGQEVVARMQNKTVVRKRVVKVTNAALTPGAEVKVGDAVVGHIGSVKGSLGLAMVRIDRIAEAVEKKLPVTSNGQTIGVDPVPVARYMQSVIDKPVIDL
jgi:folate-binding protein YgfZ